ncbi:probable glycosyltransferase 6 [Phragmites australis]|uniref:probable glycosyltransferase 6 n=1 Tax=Phragmites australis TaxID=29695 RepID=UPI002D76A9AA|nr:probable glycosyltransferase 6 [Phragmites australis]
MDAPEAAPFGVSAARKATPHGHVVLAGRARDALVFAAGAAAAVLVVLASASVLASGPSLLPAVFPAAETRTFYDDPEVAYTVDRRITGWDAKRAEWLRSRGLSAEATAKRVVMVSGSQPEPCPGAAGDHLLLRSLKNKLDYCRLHGIQLLYNRAFLQPAMTSYWAKIPMVRAAMLAHPEAEWVWWVDEDAIFTDMDFSLPLAKYSRHNFVVYGWPKKLFEKKSWLGLNAGVFLIRNCQWSLDFMDEWARMGPTWPEYARWGKVLKATLSDKDDDVSCDQSALVYMLLNNWARWGNKTCVETEYYFQGFWKGVMDRLDGVAERYEAVERRTPGLRRRHAEREHLRYAAARNVAVREAVPGPAGGGSSGWRRPLITHFAGCQPCSGNRNPIYSRESCDDGMRRALDFADDQVLRAYGFRHAAPLNDSVRPLPFDYPAAPARNR